MHLEMELSIFSKRYKLHDDYAHFEVVMLCVMRDCELGTAPW